jgi:CheY-like chemotaxis protein
MGAGALLALFCFASLQVRAGEAYTSALDKRFATGSPDQGSSQMAALEDGLRAQVQKMAQPPSSSAATQPEVVDSGFVWEMVMVLAAGLIGLIFLRSYHKTLFGSGKARKRPLPVRAEDAAMAELVKVLNLGAMQGPALENASVAPGSTAAPAPNVPAAPPLTETVTTVSATFQRLSRATADPERMELLRELSGQVTSVKEGSGLTGLRSVWLLASALHGLLKQFSMKSSNMTPSAIRTAATAIDLLGFLSTRNVRGDLVTNPPVRLLAVDDEPISRRAVAVALKKVFSEPDIAPDGPSALALATQHAYDVVFLDIEMPGMDGFEVCTKVHELERNQATPVVFVTSHHDFESRAKSAVVGANDLMAKPFLAFEIALKALTLVVRTRAERETRSLLEKPKPVAITAPPLVPAGELCAAAS